jgi:DNA repair photolyase
MAITTEIFTQSPLMLENGKPVDWYVNEQVEKGVWRIQLIPAEIVGLPRDITIFRAARKTNFISQVWHGDADTFCPPIWSDLAIGSGACGLGCRSCFLMLTHRVRRDPMRHLLYDNMNDFEQSVEKWLRDPKRRRVETLGIGIDRSDSLLYEGVMPYVRTLAPIFANEKINNKKIKMVLLTKTKNIHYLEDIPEYMRKLVVVSFSLSPEGIADLWEGKYPDTGERISPSIYTRLKAAVMAQNMGFEVRVRLDPILTPTGWIVQYQELVEMVRKMGLNFSRWTLGTYREKNAQLDSWRKRWGLLPMEYEIDHNDLVKDGTHKHLNVEQRRRIYSTIMELIQEQFPKATGGLCKETHQIRREMNLCNSCCNCLI